MPLPPPVIVISRHGDFTGSVTRAKALRPVGDHAIVEVEPATDGADGLAGMLGEYETKTPVNIVTLVGDLDGTRANVETLVKETASFAEALKKRFPLLRSRVWFVLRTGPEVGPKELRLAVAAQAKVRDSTLAATVVVTEGTGASHAHPKEDVDRQIGDLLHVIAMTTFFKAVTETDARTWAVGIGSVVYRPDGLVNAAVRAIDESLARLADGSLRDPSRNQGTRWVADRHLGPPRPGEDRDDSEAVAVLAGPGRGSVADDPARELRRLDGELEALDPGLWAGMIAAAIDVASAPRTEPDSPDRSPLVVATDQVQQNLVARGVELRADLEAEARRVLAEQQSIPSADAWCEGARAAIQQAVDELTLQNEEDDEEPLDLAADYTRLAKLARVLPYSSSVLVRGLLLVVLLLVLGYVYAPVGSFVSWAFSKRVLFFGDTLEDNARTWARITAAGTGLILWLWWEAKWRRIRRYRRRYVKRAQEQLRRMVEQVARQGRIDLLREIHDFIGTPDGPDGSLRRWLHVNGEALDRLRQRAIDDQSDSAVLMQGPWAVVIPSGDDPTRVLDQFDPARRSRLEQRPVDVMHRSPLDVSLDDAEAALRAAIDAEFPETSRDLSGHWPEVDAIGVSARSALTASLWSGMAPELSARAGATRQNRLVVPTELEAVIEGVGSFDSVITSQDDNFVANLWTTLIRVGAEPPDPKVAP